MPKQRQRITQIFSVHYKWGRATITARFQLDRGRRLHFWLDSAISFQRP